MTPLFIVAFGETQNKFAEMSITATAASDAPSLVDSVINLVVELAIIGVGTALLGFAVVALWSIVGERQVGMKTWMTKLYSGASKVFPI